MVTINIQKKDLFLISAIAVFLIGAGIVIAYGGNNPSVMGHSFSEINTNCRLVMGPKTTNASIARCNSDEILFSGGGECQYASGPGTVYGYLHSSRPQEDLKGWTADCYDFEDNIDIWAVAYAVCCK